MTTLQDALDKCERVAIESGAWESYKACRDAFAELRTALEQQGEQQPVAWYEYNQDLDAWFLAYGHNPKAKARPLVFGDTAAPAPACQGGEMTTCSVCCSPASHS